MTIVMGEIVDGCELLLIRIYVNILDIGPYVYKDLWTHGLYAAMREVADNYR